MELDIWRSEYERAKSLAATINGGLYFGVWNPIIWSGGADFWLIKTDSYGVMEWNMIYGGEENEYGGSLVVNNDEYWLACIQQPTVGMVIFGSYKLI